VEEQRRTTGKKSAADVIANANRVNTDAQRVAIERSVSVESDTKGIIEVSETKPVLEPEVEVSKAGEADLGNLDILEELPVSAREPEEEAGVDSDGDIEMLEPSATHTSQIDPVDSQEPLKASSPPPQAISPPKKTTRPTRKRKAITPPSPDLESKPTARTRGKGRKVAPVPQASTRSLRSRAVRTEAEEKEEMERRERVRMALESDEEWLSDGDIG
jgi:hypothetical protein